MTIIFFLVYVAAFSNCFIFGDATSSHERFFRAATSSEELIWHNSYFFEAATSSEQLLLFFFLSDNFIWIDTSSK